MLPLESEKPRNSPRYQRRLGTPGPLIRIIGSKAAKVNRNAASCCHLDAILDQKVRVGFDIPEESGNRQGPKPRRNTTARTDSGSIRKWKHQNETT